MSDWKTYPQEVPEEFERITFYSHSLSFYFKGIYSGSKRGTNNAVGEVWNGEFIRRIRAGDLWKHGDELPPPRSPESAETTPLAEEATAAATSGDEITAEKLRAEEGWEEEDENDFSISLSTDSDLNVYEHEGVFITICEFWKKGESYIKIFKITTMSELRTLIRWLS